MEKILSNWSISFSPWKMGLFKINSPNKQPILQISISGPYLLTNNNNSGALYHSVTTTGV